MKYSDFNLKVNTEVASVDNINILQYLPIEEKNDIIRLTLQESAENGLFNLLKVRMFFNLFIVYSYTDIEFTEKDKNDPVKLYDELYSNGIIDTILSNMNDTELTYLESVLQETLNIRLEYQSTVASIINSFIKDMPANAESAMKIINNFNPADFQQVIDFARAANGGRSLN